MSQIMNLAMFTPIFNIHQLDSSIVANNFDFILKYLYFESLRAINFKIFHVCSVTFVYIFLSLFPSLFASFNFFVLHSTATEKMHGLALMEILVR